MNKLEFVRDLILSMDKGNGSPKTDKYLMKAPRTFLMRFNEDIIEDLIRTGLVITATGPEDKGQPFSGYVLPFIGAMEVIEDNTGFSITKLN